MSSLRVSIDIDKLGAAIKQDPNLIEKVKFKDGTEHRMIKVNIMERKQPSEHGATHYMKFDMYHKTELNGVNYYLVTATLSTSVRAAELSNKSSRGSLPLHHKSSRQSNNLLLLKVLQTIFHSDIRLLLTFSWY